MIELVEVCNRNKWKVVEIYEETISGTKGVDERVELNRMMHDACRKKFAKVIVWSVDRLGRSMKHLITTLSQLDDLNVDVYSFVQGIDTSTQFGKSMFRSGWYHQYEYAFYFKNILNRMNRKCNYYFENHMN